MAEKAVTPSTVVTTQKAPDNRMPITATKNTTYCGKEALLILAPSKPLVAGLRPGA